MPGIIAYVRQLAKDKEARAAARMEMNK
jgi:hypothetical protein